MATSTETTAAAAVPTNHRVRLTLSIDGTDYRVRPVDRPVLPPDAVLAFTLTRDDPKVGKVRHTIAQGLAGPVCSCEDRRYRPTPEGCKHLRAARACGLF